MTYLDAAYAVLQAAGEPLHYEEITQRALDQNLITPQGLTPAATMGSRLYVDTKRPGSRFRRAGRATFGLAEPRIGGIAHEITALNRRTRSELRKRLRGMGADRFEALVGELLIALGFDENTVKVTRYSGDRGIDVRGVVRAGGITEVNAAVQVKKWKKRNIQAPTVRDLRGSLKVHEQGIIITTSDFSSGARREAEEVGKTRISLVNCEELLDLLILHGIGVTQEQHTLLSLDEEWWGEVAGEGSLEESALAESPVDQPGEPPIRSRARSRKPTGFTLLGQSYPVDSWRGVLLGVCEALAQEHGDAFAPAAFGVKGKKRQYIAPSPEGMIGPAQIPGTDLWVEANQSAVSVQRLVKRLLVALGHDPDKFAVLLET
jgi:restriction system protein